MRLVQAATIQVRDDERTPHGNLGSVPLLAMLDLDYMGSAEFEFGAIPKALFRFCKADEPKVFGKLTLKAGKLLKPGRQHPDKANEQITIFYLVRRAKEQALIMCLEQWAFGGHPLLLDPVYPGEPNTFNICIDEDAECFFGTDTQTFETLIDCLPESYRLVRQNPSFRFDWELSDPLSLPIEKIIGGSVVLPE